LAGGTGGLIVQPIGRTLGPQLRWVTAGPGHGPGGARRRLWGRGPLDGSRPVRRRGERSSPLWRNGTLVRMHGAGTYRIAQAAPCSPTVRLYSRQTARPATRRAIGSRQPPRMAQGHLWPSHPQAFLVRSVTAAAAALAFLVGRWLGCGPPSTLVGRHRPETRLAERTRPGPALQPRGRGVPRVVASSEVDGRLGGAGQLGGPMHGHHGGHGGVDAPRRVLGLLAQPGAAGVFAQDGVRHVAGQPGVAVMGQGLVDDQLLEPGCWPPTSSPTSAPTAPRSGA
jgi:hypothetical protein